MIHFTRHWVNTQMNGFWEEMCGLRPVLPARNLGQTPPTQVNNDIDLAYAREWIPFSELKAARLIQLQMRDIITHTGGDNWYFWNDVFHENVGPRLGDYIAEAFADQVVLAMDQIAQWYGRAIAAAQAAQNTGRVTALRAEYKNDWKKYRSFQDRIHTNAGQDALKAMVRKQCAKETDYFDDDRRWLVCRNGVVDLEEFRKTRKVQLYPHEAWRKVTRSVSCDFNRKAQAPTWLHFLETSIPDEEIRDFLQRLVGAAFMAESKVKAIPNLQGPKDCGKSIFVTTLDHVADGYGVQPSPTALTKEQGQNWEQEKLRGKRFVGVSEPSVGSKLDDTFCKQVTGGDVVHTRTHYQSSEPWVAQCVIFIASNHAVKLNTRDQAFLDRLCFIKFPHRFWDVREAADGEIHIKDPDLERKLAEEHEGILQWVFYGMYWYLERGIDKPLSVQEAGTQVAVASSGALTWIHDKITEGFLMELDNDALQETSMSHLILFKNLYRMYKSEMEQDGEQRNMLGKFAFSEHVKSFYGDFILSGGNRVPRLVGRGAWANLNEATGTAHGF